MDCVSAGESSHWAVSDVVSNSYKRVKAENIISVGEENQAVAGAGEVSSQGRLALLNKETRPVNFSYSFADWITAEEFADEKKYKGYDFDDKKLWKFIVPECPMPNNSHYYSFRE